MTNTNPTITQTTIYKTLHRKLKIDQHKPHCHSNKHLQNTTQKTKDWPTRTQLSLKQPSTKHYTVNKRLTNTNPTITQTTIYKTLHRKLKIDQHKPHYHSNNHLQNITQKTKDWPTQTQLSLKQPSTKHYTENKTLTNTNHTTTQTTIYKTLHRKLKIDQHEPNYHSNNHLQNTTQKTKDWPTQTQLSLKQPSTKHYTESKTLTNTNPTITQTTIYKTLHRKQKIDQHEPNYHSNNHLQNTTQKTKDWPTRTTRSLKQPSTKHYTENKILTNTNHTTTQTTIYKTLHRKLKIDQHEPNYHSNNHLQNTTQKTKDWPTQTQLSLKQPSTKHYTEN